MSYRNYETQNLDVKTTYKNILENQTLEHVIAMKKQFGNPKINLNIWKVFDKLNYIIDNSDPDNDLPQMIHAYQTAESIYHRYFYRNTLLKDILIKDLFNLDEWRKLPNKYRTLFDNKTLTNFYPSITKWDWLPLVGFIHDLGKILLLPQYGNLPQWSVVGDTFPVGFPLSKNFPYYSEKFHLDHDNIYNKHCGLENIHMSYSHDEYLSNVLEYNQHKHTLPKEAIYIIRFHSFYSWHTPNSDRSYAYLASDYDWYMLPLLKTFQKADLYSKSTEIPTIDSIKKTYSKLFDTYFENLNLLW